MTDHYADGTCQWWHLSRPSPELIAALGDGWLPPRGRVLDVGCGLGTETGYLASAGWQAAGIDLSETALARAAAGYGDAAFLRADVRRLPFQPHCFDAAVDRGCFHYLPPGDRLRYAGELGRVLRPGGKVPAPGQPEDGRRAQRYGRGGHRPRVRRLADRADGASRSAE
jgi:SAM-dependent methyltransferase